MADDQPEIGPRETLEIYEAYRSYVRHEDSLINFRTTWFLEHFPRQLAREVLYLLVPTSITPDRMIPFDREML